MAETTPGGRELSAAATVRSMMLPTTIPERPHEWETFRDRASGCEYLYNPSSGESKWAASAADQVRAALHPKDASAGETGGETAAAATPLRLELASPRRCDLERAINAAFDDSDDSDDGAVLSGAAEEAALDRVWRSRGVLRTVRRRRREHLSCGERACDRCLAVLEIGCCEQPAALLEALLRGPLYIVGGALLALGAVVVCVARGRDGGGGKVARNAVDFLREGCLFLAAALSLLLPGAAALIYRNMPLDDGDWDLRPLPTPLGAVDPRRFWAFYLGRCALANNGYYDPGLGSLDWPWTGAVLHPARGDQDAAALGFDAPAAVT